MQIAVQNGGWLTVNQGEECVDGLGAQAVGEPLRDEAVAQAVGGSMDAPVPPARG